MEKVPVNGVVTLHEHYLYRGYLQIAALDLTRSPAPTLWLLHWDPTQPVATRPLSLRKNGTWYTYGHDLTKNVTELYNADSTIATAYDYTPYGTVTASGIDQPIQWSSEHYDPELALVYYNYRHYNPLDGRWINRDLIMEGGGMNLYSYIFNREFYMIDALGLCLTTLHNPEAAALLKTLAPPVAKAAVATTTVVATGAIIESVDHSSSQTQDDAIPKAETKPRTEPKVTDIPEKYGDCTKQRHSELSKDVGHKCKGPIPMNCKNENMCIEDIKRTLQRLGDCQKARRQMNMECYKGGDIRHLKAIGELLAGSTRCLQLWNKKLTQG